jgi:hypothetical protein
MDPDQANEIGRKIRAAQELGLTVVNEYSEVNGSFFTTLQIMDQSQKQLIDSFPSQPGDKQELLVQLSRQKVLISEQASKKIDEIDAEIAKINALGQE